MFLVSGSDLMKTKIGLPKTKVGDVAAFRVLREFRKNQKGEFEYMEIQEEIYHLGIVSTVDRKGKAISILVGEDYFPDQGGFNYTVPKDWLDYENFLKALNSQKRYKKWTLDEVRAFISPFLK